MRRRPDATAGCASAIQREPSEPAERRDGRHCLGPAEAIVLVLCLAVAVSRANLLENGDFSRWDDPRRPVSWLVEDTTIARVERSSSPVRSQAYSAKVTRLLAGAGNNKGMHQLVAFSPERACTLSAWFFGNDSRVVGGIGINWRAADTGFITHSGTVYTDTLIRTWQRLALIDTSPPNAAFADVLIRIFGIGGSSPGGVVYADDASLGNPYDGRLLCPNGGECWAGGDTHAVSWSIRPKDFFYTRLLLSTDGGGSFPHVIAPSIPPTDTVFRWAVPQYNSAACRVKVQALDSTGSVVTEDVSDVDFTIDSQRPAAPTLLSPPDGGALNLQTVVFRWHRAPDNLSGIEHYTIQVAYDSAFLVLVDTARRAETTYARALPADTAYWWRLRATDRCGNVSAWSALWSFVIDVQTPSVPSLLSPVGGAWLQSSTVILIWTPVVFGAPSADRDPLDLGSEVRYVLQIDTLAALRPLYTDTTASPRDTFTFLPEARYWWRVRAYDLAGNQGFFSPKDSFGIDMSGPQVPVLIYPPNLGQVGEDTTSLVWHWSRDNLSGTGTYWLQLARDSLFADTIPVPRPTTPDTFEVVTLPSLAHYFWRVKALDRAGNWCAWSLPWSFSYSVGVEEPHRGGRAVPRLLYCGPTPAVRWASFVLSAPHRSAARIQIFGTAGQLVRTLYSGFIPAGEAHFKWDGSNDAGQRAGPGVYCALIKVGKWRSESRLVLAE